MEKTDNIIYMKQWKKDNVVEDFSEKIKTLSFTDLTDESSLLMNQMKNCLISEDEFIIRSTAMRNEFLSRIDLETKKLVASVSSLKESINNRFGSSNVLTLVKS